MAEKNIIYLESDEALIASLGDVLKELNYKVEFTKTASNAEKIAKSSEPHMIIVSMDIENSDPTELIKKLPKDKVLSKIPLLFISETFDENGFYDEYSELKKIKSSFIKKPFDIDDAIDIVESTIGLPSPPKGVFPVSLGAQRELISIKKENEELRAQVSEKSKLDDSSKAAIAEKQAYIKELQNELDISRKEKASAQEELELVKKDLVDKNKSLEDKEKKLDEIKNKKSQEAAKLKEEIDELNKGIKEDKEKHKKAQSALREFYKPKLAGLKELESKIKELEKELEKSKNSVDKAKELEEKIKGKDALISDLESQVNDKEKELDKLKAFREKMKKMLGDD